MFATIIGAFRFLHADSEFGYSSFSYWNFSFPWKSSLPLSFTSDFWMFKCPQFHKKRLSFHLIMTTFFRSQQVIADICPEILHSSHLCLPAYFDCLQTSPSWPLHRAPPFLYYRSIRSFSRCDSLKIKLVNETEIKCQDHELDLLRQGDSRWDSLKDFSDTLLAVSSLNKSSVNLNQKITSRCIKIYQ